MPGEADTKVLKALDTAEAQLLALDKAISKATAKLERAEIDPARIEKLRKDVMKFLKNFSAITRLQSSKGFAMLEQKTQARVIWLDDIFARLLIEADALVRAKKVAVMDPVKDQDKLLKALRESQARWQFKGIGTLVKEIKKGNEIDAPGITMLPMAVILFVLIMMIREAFKRRP